MKLKGPVPASSWVAVSADAAACDADLVPRGRFPLQARWCSIRPWGLLNSPLHLLQVSVVASGGAASGGGVASGGAASGGAAAGGGAAGGGAAAASCVPGADAGLIWRGRFPLQVRWCNIKP